MSWGRCLPFFPACTVECGCRVCAVLTGPGYPSLGLVAKAKARGTAFPHLSVHLEPSWSVGWALSIFPWAPESTGRAGVHWWKCRPPPGLRLNHSTLHACCLPASVPCSLPALAVSPRQFCFRATLGHHAKIALAPQIPKEFDQKRETYVGSLQRSQP